MIVCHCQRIDDSEIHAAIDWMRASDNMTVITPGKVYRALGKRPVCGGCLPLFMSTLERNENAAVPDETVGDGRGEIPNLRSHVALAAE